MFLEGLEGIGHTLQFFESIKFRIAILVIFLFQTEFFLFGLC